MSTENVYNAFTSVMSAAGYRQYDTLNEIIPGTKGYSITQSIPEMVEIVGGYKMNFTITVTVHDEIKQNVNLGQADFLKGINFDSNEDLIIALAESISSNVINKGCSCTNSGIFENTDTKKNYNTNNLMFSLEKYIY
jgi:hypothetical protein